MSWSGTPGTDDPGRGGELDAPERAIDHVQEAAPESEALRFVLRGCGPHFGLGISADPQRTLQRLRRSRSMRSRTSDQGSPGSSPERAWAARFAISAAHAAATPSSAPASRLAVSSAASLARPAGSSFNARSRSLVAALVTSDRYRGRSGPTSPGTPRTVGKRASCVSRSAASRESFASGYGALADPTGWVGQGNSVSSAS